MSGSVQLEEVVVLHASGVGVRLSDGNCQWLADEVAEGVPLADWEAVGDVEAVAQRPASVATAYVRERSRRCAHLRRHPPTPPPSRHRW